MEEVILTPDSQPESPIFSVRIVSIDYYMALPIPGVDICYSSFQGEKVNELPVIRIYGSTPAGQKTCLHVHQALPYLYVPCADIPLSGLEESAYKHEVYLAMEKALKLKGSSGAKRQHVHGCNLVRARRLYGYHASEELFVKIYLYHPHDVSRAAKLLLGGAVFDRSVQPHESHIPYLLQFLVDYNLYGMGHLHVTKMKFRHPTPDHVFSKRINDHLQAGSKAHLRNTVWINSTIANDWRWQTPDDLDSSVGNKGYGVKRQSTCELEGDAVVDDIVNQHLKTYTSLSQARSDVKMVQSLVPIWEEELERSGMYEAALPDPGKPGPVDVLKVLSDGLELENKLLELCAEAENTLTPSQHNLSPLSLTPLSSHERKLTDFENANSSKKCGRRSGQFNEDDESFSPQYLSYDIEVGSMTAKGKATCHEPFTHGKESSMSKQESEEKAADTEALGLLKWLATTQAVEEINSDDELAREIILSPLLPTTNVNKVLEKANMDYESESQRECLDILDSIDDYRDPKERLFRDYRRPLKDKIIPQVDGSGDDPSFSGGAVEASSKSEKKIEDSILMERQALHDAGISSVGKRKVKGPSWGNLPFSNTKEYDDNVSTNFTVYDGFSPEGDYQSPDDSGFHRQVENCFSTSKKVEHMKQARSHDGFSVRDLMRKKRKSQVFPKKEPKLNVFSCPERTSLQFSDDEESIMQYKSCPDNQKPLLELSEKKDICSIDFAEDLSVTNKKSSDSSGFSDMHGEECPNIRKKSVVSDILRSASDKLQLEEVGNPVLLRKEPISRSFLGSMLADMDGNCNSSKDRGRRLRACSSEKALENSFVDDGITEARITQSSSHYEHEPREESANKVWDYKASEYDQSADAAFCDAFPPEQKNIHKVPARLVDEVLPGDYQGGKERLNCSAADDKSSNCQTTMMGVPTYRMHDGSRLYLLKPVIPPPSVESVTSWLHHEEGYSDSLVSSKASVLGESTETMADPSSLSRSMHFTDVIHHNKQGGHHAEFDTRCSGSAIKLHVEERTVQKEAYNNISQDISQISGPDGKSGSTPLSQLGFRDPASVGPGQQLTLLSIEVQPESRGDLRPDPRFDAINVLALAIMGDDEADIEICVLLNCSSESYQRNRDGLSGCKVVYFPEEKQLVIHFVKIMNDLNPDILVGWDVQGGSLGFLAERASYLGVGLLNLVSRTPSETNIGTEGPDQVDMKLLENVASECSTSGDAVIEDEWGRTHASGLHVGGRIVLNLWRLTRGEIKLNLYTIEAVAEAVLRQKVPSIQNKILTKWFSTGSGRARYRCIEYVIKRVKLNFEIMNQLDLVNRTSELARVFGIDFFSVLSRGSQYRVESMLLRLARTQNYVAISPGSQQVASQPAMECMPLVMEPESGFYGDPVVVLDFQSLYPSMIIAYNLCFCTCLGKVPPSKDNILGVTSYSADPEALCNFKDRLLLAPNGAIYVPTKVREGILPRLLREILSTRIMVKQAMKKLGPSQHVLRRIFNARQLALKLIANVTYGYTAAGFSGRMPCAELADSIVQCGRRTLENAISYVNAQNNWKARVIYGDTDSMFVLLKGRTVKEAFQIGQEIASAISGINPEPVTLKMEKVYHPCFLLTKKRYVGYSYESPDQVEPTFDAKGIETVRRDTCPAVAKAMEQSLRLYFEQQNISEIKSYLHRQWTRILSGRISLQDFVFAKEVRLGTYSTRTSSLPPAAIVATKAMKVDPRAEPRYAERIPYVVVHGEPGARLSDMVVDPLDVLALDSPYRLNGQYYITKQIIPALQRVFGLVGADLNQWYLEMPRPARESYAKRPVYAQNQQRTRIDYYYVSRHCVLCGELVPNTTANLCSQCQQKGSVVAATLTGKTAKLEKEMQHLTEICDHCGGGDWIIESGIKCTSLACPVFYERRKVQKELMGLSAVASKEGFYPNCMFEWF